MKGYIANTDYGWYRYLLEQHDLEEVNFWRPLGGTQFKVLKTFEPFFFKLKKAYNNAVVGFGFFAMYQELSAKEAWAVFVNGNGAASFEEMWTRVAHYMRKNKGQETVREHRIGCILLTSPIFFPEDLWIEGPTDWKGQIVSGKTYDTSQGEGKRIWNQCLQNVELLQLGVTASHNISAIREERFGAHQLFRPRLGQGTFRYAVQDAYKKCAITLEHSIPALEAAHIIPYSEGGTHEISNGVLLRADVHKLYDRGYVSITPDYEFAVSERLQSEFQNGRVYYQLEGKRIWLPENAEDRPKQENLEYHYKELYLGS